MKLLLFDIDGTLLHCGAQVRRFFSRALEAVYDTVPRLEGFDFSGKVDPRIVVELMQREGWEAPAVRERLPAMQAHYLEQLARGLERDEMRLLPGVDEELTRLSTSPGTSLGLLTGNWRQGARIKLGRFDLNRFFPFGAFGDDAEDRLELPPFALRRASEHCGRPVGAADAVIVGDSVRDVACGRACGIPVVAVATGWTPVEQLAAAGAATVIDGLPQLEAALAELETRLTAR